VRASGAYTLPRHRVAPELKHSEYSKREHFAPPSAPRQCPLCTRERVYTKSPVSIPQASGGEVQTGCSISVNDMLTVTVTANSPLSGTGGGGVWGPWRAARRREGLLEHLPSSLGSPCGRTSPSLSDPPSCMRSGLWRRYGGLWRYQSKLAHKGMMKALRPRARRG
jgi:hypothetical protein